jgi:hypothetical protein
MIGVSSRCILTWGCPVTHERAAAPLQDPKAQLERQLREEYLRERGYDEASLEALPPETRLDILRHASIHVAARLAEVDARSTYVHEIHGSATPKE